MPSAYIMLAQLLTMLVLNKAVLDTFDILINYACSE